MNGVNLEKLVDLVRPNLQRKAIPIEKHVGVGAITELKKSVGWTIDKFRLNNSLVINDTILRFSYRKIDVQRRTFSNFWDFCCCKHQVIAVWILVSEGRDKKGRFV